MPEALYAGQRYTADEVEYLRGHYALLGRDRCARELGRTPAGVQMRARRLGLARRRGLPDCEATLRRLHERGLSDKDVAARLGVCLNAAWRWRRALGLPANLGPRECGKLAAKAALRKARAHSCASVAAYVALRKRLAADAAWPGCVTKMQVRCCRHLAGHGPSAARQIAVAVAMNEDNVRRSLAQLEAAGLVRSEVPAGGRRRVYTLAGRRSP